MDITANVVAFGIMAAVIVSCSILTVTTKHILRSATYLLFVLFATAGIYFQLDYSFLGAVQLTVYAGGIIVLYVFSILLTSSDDEQKEPLKSSKVVAGLVAALAGAGLCICIIACSPFNSVSSVAGELDQKVIGTALMGSGKYQYVLPFEAISILLLSCIVGGIMIARKRK